MKNLGKVITIGISSLSLLFAGAGTGLGAGSLDSEFGTNGVVVTDFGIGDDGAYDLVVQPDGKIVVAGFSYNGAVRNMAVARYLPDGTLDTGFSSEGFATFSLGTGDTVARSLALQEDGKIVVAGSTEEADLDIAVVRLTVDGNIDTSFGSSGHLVLSEPDGDEYASTVKVAADGAILVAGSKTREDSPVTTVVVRIDAEGAVDSGFGDDGVVTVERVYSNSAYSLNVRDDGSILVAGSNSSNGGYTGSLFQLNSDGSPDKDFGTDGEVSLSIEEGDSEFFDVMILDDGRILAAGYMHNGSYREPMLAGLQENGVVDEGFGQEGVIHTDLGYDGVAYAIAKRADGSILMTGYEITPSGKDMILLEVDGARVIITEVAQETDEQSVTDQEFVAQAAAANVVVEEEDEQQVTAQAETVTARYLVTDIAAYDDVSRAISVLPEGTVITAGYASNGTDTDVALVQYTEEQLPASACPAADAPNGVVSGSFFISTFPIFNIERNSAAGGGSITERVNEEACKNYCQLECAGNTDADCYDSCYAECIPQDVVERGVVFSIVPYPVYRSGDAEDAVVDADVTGNIFPDSSFETSYNYDVVRSGQTSDGTGIGEFGSDIYNITPDVVYYVRAYAVLEDETVTVFDDETVIYGNQVTFRTNDSCFIATAAFGSILDDHVVVLRQFRDQILTKYVLGRNFIKVYYKYSPEIADMIRHHEMLRSATRISLMPVVGLSYIILHGSLLSQVVMLLFALSAIILLMLLLIRIRGGKRL